MRLDETKIQICRRWVFDYIIQSVETSNFRDCLKTANITPIFIKDNPLEKVNYRPTIDLHLPLLSKVYEKLIYNQVYEFAENILNTIICCFRKAHSTQHA